jgi:hypothetical protein
MIITRWMLAFRFTSRRFNLATSTICQIRIYRILTHLAYSLGTGLRFIKIYRWGRNFSLVVSVVAGDASKTAFSGNPQAIFPYGQASISSVPCLPMHPPYNWRMFCGLTTWMRAVDDRAHKFQTGFPNPLRVDMLLLLSYIFSFALSSPK